MQHVWRGVKNLSEELLVTILVILLADVPVWVILFVPYESVETQELLTINFQREAFQDKFSLLNNSNV